VVVVVVVGGVECERAAPWSDNAWCCGRRRRNQKSSTSNHQRKQGRKEGVIQERPRLEEAQHNTKRNSVFFDFRISSSLLDLIGASKQASKEGGVDGLVSWLVVWLSFLYVFSYLLKYQVPTKCLFSDRILGY